MMTNLTKGRFYATITKEGISWGTYLGRSGELLVFKGSYFASDVMKLSRPITHEVADGMVFYENPENFTHTECQCLDWLMGVLD